MVYIGLYGVCLTVGMVLRPCVLLVWKVVMAFGNGYVDGSTGFYSRNISLL